MLGQFSSMARICSVALALTSAALLCPASAKPAHQAVPALDVPYEATSQPVVNAMLELANVGHNDFLIDLGCGDGRIPITAAAKYGTRGLGVDLDPRRIREARANARRRGVVGKTSFIEGDLFKTNIRTANVITLFLYPEINLKLRPRILGLTPGTRIVSHEHDMGDWRPDKTRRIGDHTLYLWVVPANVAGGWQLNVNGRAIDLRIKQKYQRITGSAVVDGRSRPIRNGRISGAQVSFDLAVGSGKWRRLTGLIASSGIIDGQRWRAKRKA